MVGLSEQGEAPPKMGASLLASATRGHLLSVHRTCSLHGLSPYMEDCCIDCDQRDILASSAVLVRYDCVCPAGYCNAALAWQWVSME